MIKEVICIAQEAIMILNRNGDNLLHTMSSTLSADTHKQDIPGLLLRLIPGGALATNNPYNMLDPENPDLTALRRLRGSVLVPRDTEADEPPSHERGLVRILRSQSTVPGQVPEQWWGR